MRRKIIPGSDMGDIFYQEVNDPRKQISTDQLAAIGAIAIAWNYVDAEVDTTLERVAAIDGHISLAVTSRINGFDGKIAIIKDAMIAVCNIPEEVRTIISATLGAAEEHKKYRDSVIHARILTADSAIAPANANRGTTYETIVTVEALNTLYERIITIYYEMIEIAYVTMMYAALPTVEGDERRSYEDTIQSCVFQLQCNQQLRARLPQLPKFPAEYRVRPKTVAPPAPPDPHRSEDG